MSRRIKRITSKRGGDPLRIQGFRDSREMLRT
jgi:hypothetical protein